MAAQEQDIPKYLTMDSRLEEYRRTPFDQAFKKILSIWKDAEVLQDGPLAVIGITEIPIASQLMYWLAKEQLHSESRLYKELDNENVLIRAYCLRTLLIIGSRLLLNIPKSISECKIPIRHRYGVNGQELPLCELFNNELERVKAAFSGDNANKPSGWWRKEII